MTMDEMKKEELKKKLSPDQYKITVDKGTEAPFSGKYVFTKDKGVYKCMVCGNPLFSSEAKFETKTPGLEGWPSFDASLPGAIKLEQDSTAGMNRTEVAKHCVVTPETSYYENKHRNGGGVDTPGTANDDRRSRDQQGDRNYP